jgi:hypothetical protein
LRGERGILRGFCMADFMVCNQATVRGNIFGWAGGHDLPLKMPLVWSPG